MKIIDILKKCHYEKIESKIILHYGTNELNLYKNLYNELINKKINSDFKGDFYIFITAYKETEDEDVCVDIFDENDTSLYFDVSGCYLSERIVYSIASSSYSDFLQYEIDIKTLEHYTYETILAHCFCEITSYGFDDNV